MYQVTATIVTYKNDPEEIKAAAESFLSAKLDVHLYLVDNSPEPTLGKYFDSDKRIDYYYLNANRGFGAGHNVIMRQPQKMGKYHLVLNPDITFGEGTIERLYAYMEENKDVGNVMPRIIFPDGSFQYLCKLLPRPIDWFARMFIPFKAIRKRINYRFEMRFSDFTKPMNVPYLSGCFMFFRKDVIEEIGVFDEHIFMYGEDADINRRIHQKYRTMYYPGVTVTHAYEGGTHKSFRLFWITVKALSYYLTKWGWFFDKERSAVNRETIRLYTVKGTKQA